MRGRFEVFQDRDARGRCRGCVMGQADPEGGLEAVGRVPKRHYSYWLRAGSNVWQARSHSDVW